ncbi:uncharacterized protein A1O9_06644 [Exophiala aquamarina CBS 119918]|uniref:Uncharacterized protein n=1 Tax=Exophiala aquamarina CBS 119918 TaxID=1182545 RepID=A0A072PHE3_9EURO|nr:uncharacterized protein A1O9_06644 [Exophiala aquamarina CBS 119918]KEF58718.1 hypothetical protein A1O9_06644 [Exophiala aquamarina CBS 119918]
MTIQLLTILSIIAPTSLFGPAIKHSGRSYPHPKGRQEVEGNGPAAGVTDLLPPPIVHEPVLSSTHASFQDTVPPTSPMLTGIEDQAPAMRTPTISHYASPTAVIQMAVATVCPDTPSSSPIFPLLALDLASYDATNTMQATQPTITSYVPIYVNATVFLTNGSSTVFLSLSTSTATISPYYQ